MFLKRDEFAKYSKIKKNYDLSLTVLHNDKQCPAFVVCANLSKILHRWIDFYYCLSLILKLTASLFFSKSHEERSSNIFATLLIRWRVLVRKIISDFTRAQQMFRSINKGTNIFLKVTLNVPYVKNTFYYAGIRQEKGGGCSTSSQHFTFWTTVG